MSSRERWTVYPLLFLTLGIAVKDKITRQVSTNRVECKTLVVTDNQGKPRVLVAPTADGGIVETVAATPTANVVIGQYNSNTGLMFTDANNRVLAVDPRIARIQTARKPNGDDAEEPPDSP